MGLILLFPNYFLRDGKYAFLTPSTIQGLQLRIHYNELLAISALFRGLYFFQFCRYFSVFASNRAHRMASMHGIRCDFSFMVKSLFKRRPFLVVSCLYGVTILYSSVVVYLLERENPLHNFDNISNCVWFTVVTMVSLGYGDFFPISLVGRSFVIGLSMFGLLLTYLVILLLSNNFILSSQENKYFQIFKKKEQRKQIKETLGRVVLRIGQIKKAQQSNFEIYKKWVINGHFSQLYMEYRKLHNHLNELRQLEQTTVEKAH